MCFLSQVPTSPPTREANEAVAEEEQIPAQAPVPFAQEEVEFPLEDQMREMSVGDAVTR